MTKISVKCEDFLFYMTNGKYIVVLDTLHRNVECVVEVYQNQIFNVWYINSNYRICKYALDIIESEILNNVA